MLTLYHARNSICSQKARVMLAEIGLDYESRVMDLTADDQFSPEYLALNPNAVVPTLVDNGLVVIESALIIEYLDRQYNQSRLMPKDRALEVEARHWLLRSIALHAAVNAMTFSTANRNMGPSGQSPDEADARLAKVPDPIARMKKKSLKEQGLASPFVMQGLHILRQVFIDMGKALHAHEWLSGPDFGIADIAVLAYIDRLERLGFAGLWESDYPQISTWLTAMRQRASYAKAVDAIAPEGSFERMRETGSPYWAEVERLWKAL